MATEMDFRWDCEKQSTNSVFISPIKTYLRPQNDSVLEGNLFENVKKYKYNTCILLFSEMAH